MDLLRFFTAGNVDDGKSTLIGRLLFDSGSISTDIIDTLTKQSKSAGEDTGIDLALLTDGLRAEREQGITIDVAYKYFTTENRKFIIADTPGHAQYTRNMFTGASTADVAIILVDARHGITDQTKRHAIIGSILGIPNTLVCVNKMDLVNYSQEVFNTIVSDFTQFSKTLRAGNVSFLPASALGGDNVVTPSTNMDWYTGSSLLEYLETVPVGTGELAKEARFQVQYVIRPQTTELHDYRGYAGSVLSGSFKVGDRIKIYPSEIETSISKIEHKGVEVESVVAGDPVIIHLSDDVDVSRGNTLASIEKAPQFEQSVEATICWMDNQAFLPGQKLLLQQNSFRTKAVIKEVVGKIDIHTFESVDFEGTLQLNDFARVQLKTAEKLAFDNYSENRQTGAFILINENTNNTVAAGTFGN